MIAVSLNQDNYTYDIHSLVKAFYPNQEVKVFVEGEKDCQSDEGLPFIRIIFRTESIEAVLLPEGRTYCVPIEQERIIVKNALKRMLYELLCEKTGRKLPWGTLTGIRPAKIAMTLLEEGKSENETAAYLADTYLVSREKAELGMEIAAREKKLLRLSHGVKGYSLYVGIPFCPTTCLYCSFTSYPICSYQQKVDQYVSALEKEMDYGAKIFSGRFLDTIYIGGGTPTTLSKDQLERLLSKITKTFPMDQVQEFTVEAGRADSITRDKLEVLKKFGVTRISVNPQTMKAETLTLIGRRHSVEQVRQAYAMARQTGFDNINMDLILGLPNETLEDVQKTMQEIELMNPDSITVHTLAVKRASRMNQWITENGYSVMQDTQAAMKAARQSADRMSMKPYYLYRQKNMTGNLENVGFARDGKYGLYNILMMEEKQSILALGPGTISKLVLPDGRIERCDTVKDVNLYLEKTDEMMERKRKLFALDEELV